MHKYVRKILGYFRRFVEGYVTNARPLNYLLVGHPTNPEAGNKKSTKPTLFVLGKENQKSSAMITNWLTSPPVLGYSDYQLPFTLHTDASWNGLGAALNQTQQGIGSTVAQWLNA